MTQESTGGLKHPANLASAGTWGKVTCQDCHDIHQPGNPTPHILKSQNIDSAYCQDCHDDVDETYGPKIGNGHPVGVAFSATDSVIAPAGNAIDDDDFDGIDYPLNSGDLICETCHSTHRKAVESPILRASYVSGDASVLCINCHSF